MMIPKFVQKLINLGSIFGCPFCWVLELFEGVLGAFLGLLRLSWEASGPQKPYEVFANAGFWVLEALNGLLGLILAPSWADLVPKWSPKWAKKLLEKCLKQGQKIAQKTTTNK